MEESELLDWFRDYLFAHLGVRRECVTVDADFQNDLGADSLDYVALVLEVEEEFGITITDKDAEEIQTVGDAIRLIRAGE